jgi:hypothetical protein
MLQEKQVITCFLEFENKILILRRSERLVATREDGLELVAI